MFSNSLTEWWRWGPPMRGSVTKFRIRRANTSSDRIQLPHTVLRVGPAHHHGHRVPARSIPELAALNEIVDRAVDLFIWRKKLSGQHFYSFFSFSQLDLDSVSFVTMASGRTYWCTLLNCTIGCATYIVCLSIFGRVTINEPRTRATRKKIARNVHTVELRGESRAIVTLGNRARAWKSKIC